MRANDPQDAGKPCSMSFCLIKSLQTRKAFSVSFGTCSKGVGEGGGFLLIELVRCTSGLSHSQHDFFRIEIPDGSVALEEMLRKGARHASFPDKSKEYKNYNL